MSPFLILHENILGNEISPPKLVYHTLSLEAQNIQPDYCKIYFQSYRRISSYYQIRCILRDKLCNSGEQSTVAGFSRICGFWFGR